jgi:hypothetical protein
VRLRAAHQGRRPAGRGSPGLLRAAAAAIIIYLYFGQFLSKNRTAQALAGLFGVPVSSGTVAAITGRAARKLDGFLEHARDQIAGSEWRGSTRPGSGWMAGCIGCTAPAPASTPC